MSTRKLSVGEKGCANDKLKCSPDFFFLFFFWGGGGGERGFNFKKLLLGNFKFIFTVFSFFPF